MLMEVITRKEARERGLKRYYTGKPCKHGHVTERLVSNGICCTCAQSRTKEWLAKNPEYSSDQSKLWRENNPTATKEHNHRYYLLNRQYMINKATRWIKNNRSRFNNNQNKRYSKNKAPYFAAAKAYRLRRMGHMPSWVDKSDIINIYKQALSISKETGVKHHVDHIFPLKGKNSCGLHVPWNLQIIPASENLKKSNKLPNYKLEDFIKAT